MPPKKRQRLSSADDSEDLDVEAVPEFKVAYPRARADGSYNKTDAVYKDFITTQVSPFEALYGKSEPLDLAHVVQPAQQWSKLKKYSRFIIQGEEYLNTEFVWVKPAHLQGDDQASEKDFWVARVLEVRAVDAAHVYAKVAWMYWPHELPKTLDMVTGASGVGRRKYHGQHEVIASNYMDIIDVTCFAGKAPVQHWEEEDDEEKQTGLYWRQTYNFQSERLSDVRRHCVCKQPYNPDSSMFQCTNGKCMIWLHESCIIERTFEDKHKLDLSLGEEDPMETTRADVKSTKTKPRNRAKSKSDRKPWMVRYTGVIKQTDGKAPVVDMKKRADGSEREFVPISCLKCGTLMQ